MEAIERERARRRQAEAGKANLPTVSMRNISRTHEDEKGRTSDKVAAAVGLGSGRTYDKAAKVLEAEELSRNCETAKNAIPCSSHAWGLPGFRKFFLQ